MNRDNRFFRYFLIPATLFAIVFLFQIKNVEAALQYVSQFGTAGGGDGEFGGPQNIAIDSSDNIYVSDTGNNRVQKFNSAGVYQSQFGTAGNGAGNGDGDFSGPLGVAINSSNQVFVVDRGNARVQKFNSSGVYQSQFGTLGSGDGEFDNPSGITIDSLGNIYVTDVNNGRVQKFNSAGVFLSVVAPNGSADGEVASPYGIFIDSSDNIYLADTGNGRIQKFNSSGVFQSKIGIAGNGGGGEFSGVSDVAVDTSGNIYAADTGNNRIQKIRDVATAVFSTNVLSIDEGDADTFTIVLDTEPTDDVFITLATTTPGSGSGATMSPNVLTFTPANWDQEQTVTVTAFDDETRDGQRDVTISGEVESADFVFDGISVSDVVVTIIDNDPIVISTCEELQAMSDDLGANYQLSDNIDCNGFDPNLDGTGFIPVGTGGAHFTGSFDGNGYTISNLTIDRPGEESVALFGVVEGGTFQNVTLTGSVSGLATVGSLIAYSSSEDLTIENVSSSVSVNATGGTVGGLVGESISVTSIINSHYSGDIEKSASGFTDNFGGLIGALGDESSEISKSSAAGTINIGTDGNVYYVGGLSGQYGGSITNSSSTVDIQITTDMSVGSVGGVVGYGTNNSTEFEDISYSGEITLDAYGTEYVGGIFGQNQGISFDNLTSEVDIDITAANDGAASVGGIFGYLENTDAVVENANSSGTITTSSIGGTRLVGGLIGELLDADSISQSFSTVDIITNNRDAVTGAGGLVGYVAGGTAISDVFWNGTMFATSSHGNISSVGGIIGNNDASPTTLTHSYSAGVIDLNGTNVTAIGGLIGNTDSFDSVTDSFAATVLTIVADNPTSEIGGFLGNDSVGTLTNNFYDKTLSTQSFCTGVDDPDPAGCNAIENNSSYFKDNSTNPPLDTWDFDGIWGVVAGDYPTFEQAEESEPEPEQNNGGGRAGNHRDFEEPVFKYPLFIDPSLPAEQRIEKIKALIAELTIQLNRQLLAEGARSSHFRFMKDLELHMVDPDVLLLQQFLNARGFTVSASGEGSVGFETNYFGLKTYSALKKFQESIGILPGTGFLGPITRDKINGMNLN